MLIIVVVDKCTFYSISTTTEKCVTVLQYFGIFLFLQVNNWCHIRLGMLNELRNLYSNSNSEF